MAPRKGRGLSLPTSQGGARRERAAGPGISCLRADEVRELLSGLFRFPSLFIFTVAPRAAPPRERVYCWGHMGPKV